MKERRSPRSWWQVAAAISLVATLGPGCSCGSSDDTHAATTTTAGSGGAGGGGAGINVGGGDGGASNTCEPPCDDATQICSHGTCVPLDACATDDDCKNDTYCDPDKGCLPWDGHTPPHDDACVNVSKPGILQPTVKCEFSVAPPGDTFPGHVDVQGTPIVVNFNVPKNAGPPSIAASFTATVPGGYTENLGVIRVLRGSDCALEANLGGTDVDGDGAVDWTVSSASLAAADLDGDGSAEIVAYGADGSTLAFTRKNGNWALLWKAAPIPGLFAGAWAGPAIHDLDDDGVPEILREGAVLSATGALLAGSPGAYTSYSQGLFSVTANLDQDAAIETTNGQYVWEWQNGGWVQEAYFPGATPSAPGHVAVADFGAYGNVPAKNPELAVVRNGYVMVYAVTGELAMQPIPVPGGGGGPPTISDFDGDGLPEVGVAGQAYYTVYDIDCGPTPRPGGQCNVGTCDFAAGPCAAGGSILWSRSTQDLSSNITGSSIFDFEADGSSEVVYADECFVRVYNGKSGDVLFSQYRSSCTWYENPIVADVDGNFRADLVTPSNKACSPSGDGIACQTLNPEGVDPQFPGLRCETASDCVSGVCDSGFCRCTTNAECCGAMDDAACLEEGFKCATPDASTPGTGNTCRAAHPHGVSGIRVYHDANDKWVRSRTIWNQHAYAVTHVNEDGTVPKTSQWKNNWDDPKLNNFRQNVPGNQNGNATGDATAGPSKAYACDSSGVTLMTEVCNRGADDMAAGLSVGFYVEGQKVCSTTTSKPLAPEECESVSCVWSNPPVTENGAVDVTVTPNDDGAYAECKEGNNDGIISAVFCKPAT